MTMNTKNLLALVAGWRELTGSRDASMLTAHRSTFDRCADELAPIATALCAEVDDLRKDAERYRWLRDNAAHSFTVSRDDHKASYMPADEYMECSDGYYAGIDNAERETMAATNTIWTVHIYPNTPVGFNVYHAATLDAAIDAAKEPK